MPRRHPKAKLANGAWVANKQLRRGGGRAASVMGAISAVAPRRTWVRLPWLFGRTLQYQGRHGAGLMSPAALPTRPFPTSRYTHHNTCTQQFRIGRRGRPTIPNKPLWNAPLLHMLIAWQGQAKHNRTKHGGASGFPAQGQIHRKSTTLLPGRRHMPSSKHKCGDRHPMRTTHARQGLFDLSHWKVSPELLLCRMPPAPISYCRAASLREAMGTVPL